MITYCFCDTVLNKYLALMKILLQHSAHEGYPLQL
jgi:hypothetical protein